MDEELKAIRKIHEILMSLPQTARPRVLNFVIEKGNEKMVEAAREAEPRREGAQFRGADLDLP